MRSTTRIGTVQANGLEVPWTVQANGREVPWTALANLQVVFYQTLGMHARWRENCQTCAQVAIVCGIRLRAADDARPRRRQNQGQARSGQNEKARDVQGMCA